MCAVCARGMCAICAIYFIMCTKCAWFCITVHKMCKNKIFYVQNVHIFVTSCVHKNFLMCTCALCARGFYTLVCSISQLRLKIYNITNILIKENIYYYLKSNHCKFTVNHTNLPYFLSFLIEVIKLLLEEAILVNERPYNY